MGFQNISPHVSSWVLASAMSVVLVACGGGGSAGTGSQGGTAGPTTGGTVTQGTNSCTPNLCVDLAYSASALARLLSVNVKPNSASAVSGLQAHYTLTSGSLPPGLSLDANTGALSGAPTTNGSYTAQVQLTVDGYTGSLSTTLLISVSDPKVYYSPPTPFQGTDNQFLSSMVVGIALKPSSIMLTPPAGSVSTAVSELGAAGLSFSVVGGVPLPPGLSLDPNTGAISGTPTSPGVWFTRIQAAFQSEGQSATIVGTAAFSVAAVIQEHAGQTASPMTMHAYVEPGTSITSNFAQSIGDLTADMAYNSSTETVVVTPSQTSSLAAPGTYIGANIVLLSIPDGTSAQAMNVVVIDSAIAVH